MHTSNYARAKTLPPGLVPVSISIRPPYWWGKSRRHYPPLCPTVEMLSMPRADYDVAFHAILDKLDPRKVFEELGENAVMLCFESPNVHCHRRLCAQWLEDALGIVIPEYGFDRSFSLPYAEMLDPKPKAAKSSAASKRTKPSGTRKKWDQTPSLFGE